MDQYDIYNRQHQYFHSINFIPDRKIFCNFMRQNLCRRYQYSCVKNFGICRFEIDDNRICTRFKLISFPLFAKSIAVYQ